MRRTLLVLLILSLAAVPVVRAQDDVTPVSLAASWLAEQQAADGGFADDAATTAIAALALASQGEPNAEAIAWLEDNFSADDGMSTDVLSILLISAAVNGEDASTWLDGVPSDMLASALQSERGSNVGGLCIGLVAMKHMGQDLPPTAIGGLTALQNEDGGFPQSAGDESDVVITSVCLHTLQLADESEARDKALTYVTSQQNDDGGWGSISNGTDALTTAFVLVGLNAAGEDLPADAVAVLEAAQDRETGMVFGVGGEASEDSLDMATTGLTILALSGQSFSPGDETAVAEPAETGSEASAGGDFPEGPALDANWALISDGFEDPTVSAGFPAPAFDTADDFFVTVVDPFTDDELYGVEIINWTAEYQYTGYIVEQFLPAEVLLYMAEQDPSTWEKISVTTLQMLAPEELAKLPDDVQARAAE